LYLVSEAFLAVRQRGATAKPQFAEDDEQQRKAPTTLLAGQCANRNDGVATSPALDPDALGIGAALAASSRRLA
jgi:hypothetical protein